MDELLSQIPVAVEFIRTHFWQQPQKENLAALATNIILGGAASVLFSLTYGTPRLHSTIKLWSETLTRLQWAATSYYIYLMITNKDNAQFVVVFGAISFGLMVFSAWFTKGIVTDIDKKHICTFDSIQCPVTDRRNCSFPKPIIIDRNQCLTEITWWHFGKILFPNIVIAGLNTGLGLFTALYFQR